jgi:hypothetical protein
MPSLCASSIMAFSSSGVPQRLLACLPGGGGGEEGAGGVVKTCGAMKGHKQDGMGMWKCNTTNN